MSRKYAEVWKAKNFQWFYTVHYGNHQTDTSRKSYVTKWNAKRAVMKREGLTKADVIDRA